MSQEKLAALQSGIKKQRCNYCKHFEELRELTRKSLIYGFYTRNNNKKKR